MNTLSKEEFVEKLQAKRSEPAKPGHNGSPQLRSYVDRLVNLKTEKASLSTDIAELKKEAKGNGFDPRALEVIAKREMEDADQKAKREELASVVDTYATALGLVL